MHNTHSRPLLWFAHFANFTPTSSRVKNGIILMYVKTTQTLCPKWGAISSLWSKDIPFFVFILIEVN